MSISRTYGSRIDTTVYNMMTIIYTRLHKLPCMVRCTTTPPSPKGTVATFVKTSVAMKKSE